MGFIQYKLFPSLTINPNDDLTVLATVSVIEDESADTDVFRDKEKNYCTEHFRH